MSSFKKFKLIIFNKSIKTAITTLIKKEGCDQPEQTGAERLLSVRSKAVFFTN